MQPEYCVAEGCDREALSELGLCRKHWDMLPRGYQYECRTAYLRYGTGRLYTNRVRRMIDICLAVQNPSIIDNNPLLEQ